MLHNVGQNIWLDNITRYLLSWRTPHSHIDKLSVTGLTSNPTIFNHAIKNTNDYDDAIRNESAIDLTALQLSYCKVTAQFSATALRRSPSSNK